MLRHAVELAGRNLRIHHELLVAQLESIPLKYLLLLWRQAVHELILVVLKDNIGVVGAAIFARIVHNVLVML